MGNSWDIPPGYVNIAIEMAIYSGFIHQKWWCSIVFCMFTRGYHGPWYTSCWYHWVFKMTTMDTVRVPSMYPKLVSCNIVYDYIPLSKIWMWLYIPLGTCGHLCDMYVYIYIIYICRMCFLAPCSGAIFWPHVLPPARNNEVLYGGFDVRDMTFRWELLGKTRVRHWARHAYPLANIQKLWKISVL